MEKVRLATIWLDGCSGCHMSLLDMDERLAELAGRMALVYSPLVDVHEIPDAIDVVLVEGAVATTADYTKILRLRECSRILVAFGDCAVTSNVPGMRNRFEPEAVLERAYPEGGGADRPRWPREGLPALRRRVLPVHEFVHVDAFLPGCPPPADAIHYLLSSLLDGHLPNLLNRSRFGA
jgi:NAD-reducing hydrogenase small subunit